MGLRDPGLADVLGRELRHDAYLTDGRRLYRVVDSGRGAVQLENCAVPEESPGWVEVREILSGSWRLVRPASSAVSR